MFFFFSGRLTEIVIALDCELNEAKYSFEVDMIIDKRFKQISHDDNRKIWQHNVKWIGQSDSWEPAALIATIALTKVSLFEAQRESPEEVDQSLEAQETATQATRVNDL